MNLEKLSPAPWLWTAFDPGDGAHTGGLVDGNGKSILSPTNEGDLAIRSDDAAFIKLARDAFDVMERRHVYPMRVQKGWSVWCTTPHGWSACMFGVTLSDLRYKPATWPGPWADPFTALIEADKWYTENVEKAPTGLKRN